MKHFNKPSPSDRERWDSCPPSLTYSVKVKPPMKRLLSNRTLEVLALIVIVTSLAAVAVCYSHGVTLRTLVVPLVDDTPQGPSAR